MGEVYLAATKGAAGFGLPVALKILRPELASDRSFVDMMIDEAKISMFLNHQNIVSVLDFAEEQGTYYLAMEYVQGITVEHLVEQLRARGKLLELGVALFIGTELMRALKYAHSCQNHLGEPLNLVHRDVTPANLLLSTQGEVKLTDFGIARAKGRIHQTQAGVVKGKFGYLAPEMTRYESIDARADLFSAGVVLYQLLSGVHPVAGASIMEAIFRYEEKHIKAPSTHNPEITPALDEVIMRALEPSPDARWASAQDLGSALQSVAMLTPRWRRGLQQGPQALSAIVREVAPEAFGDPFAQVEAPPPKSVWSSVPLPGRAGRAPQPAPAPVELSADLIAEPEDPAPGSEDQTLGMRAVDLPFPLPKASTPQPSISRPGLGVAPAEGRDGARRPDVSAGSPVRLTGEDTDDLDGPLIGHAIADVGAVVEKTIAGAPPVFGAETESMPALADLRPSVSISPLPRKVPVVRDTFDDGIRLEDVLRPERSAFGDTTTENPRLHDPDGHGDPADLRIVEPHRHDGRITGFEDTLEAQADVLLESDLVTRVPGQRPLSRGGSFGGSTEVDHAALPAPARPSGAAGLPSVPPRAPGEGFGDNTIADGSFRLIAPELAAPQVVVEPPNGEHLDEDGLLVHPSELDDFGDEPTRLRGKEGSRHPRAAGASSPSGPTVLPPMSPPVGAVLARPPTAVSIAKPVFAGPPPATVSLPTPSTSADTGKWIAGEIGPGDLSWTDEDAARRAIATRHLAKGPASPAPVVSSGAARPAEIVPLAAAPIDGAPRQAPRALSANPLASPAPPLLEPPLARPEDGAIAPAAPSPPEPSPDPSREVALSELASSRRRLIAIAAIAIGLALVLVLGLVVLPRFSAPRVQINTNPPGARVVIDGSVASGVTPTAVDVPAGRPFSMELSLEGHTPEVRELGPLDRGQTLGVAANLARYAPEVRISPVAARVTSNGSPAGRGREVKLPVLDLAEPVELVIEADGYEPQIVRWPRGSKVPPIVEVTLERR